MYLIAGLETDVDPSSGIRTTFHSQDMREEFV